MSTEANESPPEGGEQVETESGEHGEAEVKRGRLGRLEALVPDLLRRAIAQGADALADEKVRERLVGDVVKKAISVGSDVYEGTEDQLRRILAEVPDSRVPAAAAKEIVDRLSGRLDDYKGELFRLVTDEVQQFLDRVDIGHELQKMLTSLTFQITTEIRFVPSEGDSSGVRPKVKAKVKVKRSRPRKTDP